MAAQSVFNGGRAIGITNIVSGAPGLGTLRPMAEFGRLKENMDPIRDPDFCMGGDGVFVRSVDVEILPS
jgi:hypothetical protein